MPSMLFIRHAHATVSSRLPPAAWPLSEAGKAASIEMGRNLDVDALRIRLFSSTEVKAIQTAEHLGLGSVQTDERLGEVGKPRYDSGQEHDNDVAHYLNGSDLSGWEPRAKVVERFDQALNDIGLGDKHTATVIVTHGTVLALWLHEQGLAPSAAKLWNSLEMPHMLRYVTL